MLGYCSGQCFSVCYSLTTLAALRNDVESGSLLGDCFPGRCRSFSELHMNICAGGLMMIYGQLESCSCGTYSRSERIKMQQTLLWWLCEELSVISITLLIMLPLLQTAGTVNGLGQLCGPVLKKLFDICVHICLLNISLQPRRGLALRRASVGVLFTFSVRIW